MERATTKVVTRSIEREEGDEGQALRAPARLCEHRAGHELLGVDPREGRRGDRPDVRLGPAVRLRRATALLAISVTALAR